MWHRLLSSLIQQVLPSNKYLQRRHDWLGADRAFFLDLHDTLGAPCARLGVATGDEGSAGVVLKAHHAGSERGFPLATA